MNWLDVAGPPGSGKSTLCDPIWGPTAFAPYTEELPPAAWHDFMNEITRLLHVIEGHPSFVSAVRMNRRTLRKMACVMRDKDYHVQECPYIQAGFVQRGLGFGWRMTEMGIDINELRHFFRLMPVSIGVVMLEVDEKENIKRNKARELVPETAHENRSFMVPLMQPAIQLAEEVLNERGVSVLKLNTGCAIDECRASLIKFADRKPCTSTKYKTKLNEGVLSPPVWW